MISHKTILGALLLSMLAGSAMALSPATTVGRVVILFNGASPHPTPPPPGAAGILDFTDVDNGSQFIPTRA